MGLKGVIHGSVVLGQCRTCRIVAVLQQPWCQRLPSRLGVLDRIWITQIFAEVVSHGNQPVRTICINIAQAT
jgi:hypothetical protein